MLSLRWSAPLLAGLALVGCAAANPEEVRRAQAEADRYSCLEQGFQEGGENFALCRHILRLPPVVALDAGTLIASVSDTVQRYLTGPLPDSS